jgi:sulfite reductase alpha subunit-like flavoprotein
VCDGSLRPPGGQEVVRADLGVRAALVDIYREHTGGSSAQAQDWLADLRAQDRFLEDIWGS